MIYVFDKPKIVGKWVTKQTGVTFSAPFEAIGIVKGPKFVGAAIFNNYTGPNIELTIVGRSTITKEFMAIIGRYAFYQLGCDRLGITYRKGDDRVARIACRLGWKYEGCLSRFYGDCDAVVMGLVKENIPPWIETRIGELELDMDVRKQRPAAA